MRLCELKNKEVINICDCQKLGPVYDVEIDFCCCKVTHIIVLGPCKLWGILGRENEYVIDVRHVKQVGHDIILVDIKVEDCIRKCTY